MDLSGISEYTEAQGHFAQAQASASDTLADIPQKLAQAELTHQQAVHQYLENVARALDISWDAQAHDHLIRARTQALQRARTARLEAEKLESHARRLTWVMSGTGTWSAIRDGWIAFDFVMSHIPAAVALKGYESQPEQTAFDPLNWRHPSHAVPDLPESHDGGSLLGWAKSQTCYPVMGTPAWTWVSSMIQAVNDGLKQAAADLQAKADKLQADARELEKTDWDRLKKQPQKADS